MMNDYKVSDYGIFTNAISTTDALKGKLDAGNTQVQEVETVISNDSVYMGPAAEEAKNGINQSKTKLTNLSGNMTTIKNYLTETSTNYHSGDNTAAETVANVGDGATLQTLEHKGQLVYYSQRGYYDQNGQFHRWQSSWGKDIASSGCGPTSMAACLTNMLNDPSITPSTIANMLNYDDNVGGNYVKKAADHYGLDQTHQIGLDKEKMNNFLRNNGKMIVAVNNGGHYVAVVGIDDSSNPPKYIVNDPNDSDGKMKTWTYSQLSTGHTMVFHIAPKGKTVEECIKPQTVQV